MCSDSDRAIQRLQREAELTGAGVDGPFGNARLARVRRHCELDDDLDRRGVGLGQRTTSPIVAGGAPATSAIAFARAAKSNRSSRRYSCEFRPSRAPTGRSQEALRPPTGWCARAARGRASRRNAAPCRTGPTCARASSANGAPSPGGRPRRSPVGAGRSERRGDRAANQSRVLLVERRLLAPGQRRAHLLALGRARPSPTRQ